MSDVMAHPAAIQALNERLRGGIGVGAVLAATVCWATIKVPVPPSLWAENVVFISWPNRLTWARCTPLTEIASVPWVELVGV